MHIPDVLDDPEYVYPRPFGYRALLGMPIKIDEDRIGVMVLVRREPGAFSNPHIALVQSFADQAAIALTNARLLEAVGATTCGAPPIPVAAGGRAHHERGRRAALAGHRAYITCVLCDLRGFTAFAETAAPEELFDVLREYQGALSRLIPRTEARSSISPATG